MSVPLRSAPWNVVLVRLDPIIKVFKRLLSVRSAFVRFAPNSAASFRIAPVRFVLVRLANTNELSVRLAPWRLASVRLPLVSWVFSKLVHPIFQNIEKNQVFTEKEAF